MVMRKRLDLRLAVTFFLLVALVATAEGGKGFKKKKAKDVEPSKEEPSEIGLPVDASGTYKTGREMCDLANSPDPPFLEWSDNVCHLTSGFFSIYGVNDHFYADLAADGDSGFTPCGQALRASLRSIIAKFRAGNVVPYKQALGGFRAVLGGGVCRDEIPDRFQAVVTEMVTATSDNGQAVNLLLQLTKKNLMSEETRRALLDLAVSYKKKGSMLAGEPPADGKCLPEEGMGNTWVEVYATGSIGSGQSFENLFENSEVKISNGPSDSCPDPSALLSTIRFAGTFVTVVGNDQAYAERKAAEGEAVRVQFNPLINLRVDQGHGSIQAGLNSYLAFLESKNRIVNLPEGFFVAKIPIEDALSGGFVRSRYVRLRARTILADAVETKYYELIGASVQHGGHYTALGLCDGTDRFIYHDGIAETFAPAMSTATALTDPKARNRSDQSVPPSFIFVEISAEKFEEKAGDVVDEVGVGAVEQEHGMVKDSKCEAEVKDMFAQLPEQEPEMLKELCRMMECTEGVCAKCDVEAEELFESSGQSGNEAFLHICKLLQCTEGKCDKE